MGSIFLHILWQSLNKHSYFLVIVPIVKAAFSRKKNKSQSLVRGQRILCKF